MEIDFKALSGPFSPTLIHWRIGATNGNKAQNKPATKGIPLAYLDARDVMERLDTVCTPAAWQNRYPFSGCCEIGILCGEQWVWKANGAGQTDIEAEKGQFSDAFKRAAVLWGVGRYLYDLPNIWVDVEQRGRSTVIPDPVQANLTDRLAKWQATYFKEQT